MALRTTCLCDGRITGIESIYTIIDGKQINIPEKLEALRKRSRNNELFCPCGCGANLILVAGDRNLREQHFRLCDTQREKECEYVSEGPLSIASKIVLKCWLEDKTPGAEIASRVPISELSDTAKKYEITFLAKDTGVAILYCHERANLSDEKLDLLRGNSPGIHLHYITSVSNAGIQEQYPEMMMKIQKRQGYCLFLAISTNEQSLSNYSEAKLIVCFYHQNNDGFWTEVKVLSDMLSEFRFDSVGNLIYRDALVSRLTSEKETAYMNELAQKEKAAEQQRREAEMRKNEQNRIQRRLVEQNRREIIKRQEYQARIQREKEEKAAAEENARRKIEAEYSKEKVSSEIDNDQETVYRDPLDRRWVRCEYCGIVDIDSEFSAYGGSHHTNLGTCKACSRIKCKTILPQYQLRPKQAHKPKQSHDSMICPRCGSKLVKRYGRRGPFVGCSDYPKCNYLRDC